MICRIDDESHVDRVNDPSRWCYYDELDGKAFENVYIKKVTLNDFIRIQCTRKSMWGHVQRTLEATGPLSSE